VHLPVSGGRLYCDPMWQVVTCSNDSVALQMVPCQELCTTFNLLSFAFYLVTSGGWL